MCAFLSHQLLTSVEDTRKKFSSGLYLGKCHTTLLPLTFNAEEYTDVGSDSLEKKGLHSFSILDKAFYNFENEEGVRTMCLHSFIYSFIHAFIYLTNIETLIHSWVLGAKQTKNSCPLGAHF